MYARTLAAQSDVYELAAELGAGEREARGHAARGRVGGGGRARAPPRRGAARGRLPGEVVEHEELPAALRRGGLVACLTENDGALHPARWYRLLAGAAEAAGARICEGSPVRARARAGRGSGRDRRGQRPRPPRGGGRRRRAARARAGVRRPRARAPAAHDRHRAAAAALDTLVYARWGYEYLQQRPDGRISAAASATWTPRTPTQTAMPAARRVERMERYLREDLGADPRSRIAGPAWWATPRTRCHTWARCRAARPLRVGRLLGRGRRPRLHVRPRPGGHDRRRRARAAVPAGPVSDAPRARAGDARGAHACVRADVPARRALAGRRRGVVLSAPRAVAGLPDARRGRRVWDVDGNEYLDFHNGFSAMVHGHAHPAITAAVSARASAVGTHFGRPPRRRWR